MKSNYGFYKVPEYSNVFYDPLMTFDGRKMSLTKGKKPNFTRARRFSQYEYDARRLGEKLGPGTYDDKYLNIGTPKNSSIPLFCRFQSPLNKTFLGSNMQKSILKGNRRRIFS